MKAIILAAGKGERLGDVTCNIPKPMIEIKGKPVLEHNINMCLRAGVKDICINLHHLPEKIKKHFGNGDNYGVKIKYNYETELLGTVGGVKSFNRDIGQHPFFVIYGDTYLDFDLSTLKEFHERKGSDFTVVLFRLDDTSNSGVVKLDRCERIKKFVEKPINSETDSHWVNAGIYLIEPFILDKLNTEYYDFGYDVIPMLIDNGFNVYGYKTKKKVIIIDTPELLNNVMRE